MTSAPRLGARGLAQLQQRLDERDLAVLHDVSKLRLMSGRQLQSLYLGQDTAAARAAGRLLLRLTKHHLLVRLPRQIGGVRAGSGGFVYALGPVGHRLLYPGDRLRARREVSDGFVDHTLALSELYVQLKLGDQRGDFELLSIDSEPQCWRRIDSLGGVDWLKPDLHVVMATGDREWHSFVEWDNATEHRAALLRKLHAYEAAYRAGREQTEHGIFPRVVWLVPSETRARNLRKLIAAARSVTGDLHVIALHSDALAYLTGSHSGG